MNAQTVAWGVGHNGDAEHAFPVDQASPLTALCGNATSLTDPPTERPDLDPCDDCDARYRQSVEGLRA